MAQNPNRFSAHSSSSSGHSHASSPSYSSSQEPLPPPPPEKDPESHGPFPSLSEKLGTALPERFTTTTATMPQYIWDKDPEIDDAMHNPHYKERWYSKFTPFSSRGWQNVVALLLIIGGLLTLFVGYPIIDFVVKPAKAKQGYNMGGTSFLVCSSMLYSTGTGINATGQIPQLSGMPSLIDRDTPEDVLSRTGSDGQKYDLVFSDEFNVDGRSFYPGDDPFWEAADLYYWCAQRF